MRNGFSNHLKMIAVLFCVGLLLAFALSCSSGGGGGGGSSTTTSQGIFVDSPAEGLQYETPTQSGITDAEGTFEYQEGEIITFSIGDIVLGSGSCKQIMSPIDLIEEAIDETHKTVTNIAMFLLSLDKDGDWDNGISIIETIRNECEGRSIDFTQNIVDFENDPDVQNLFDVLNDLGVFTDGGVRTLCSAEQAQSHLANTLGQGWSTPIAIATEGEDLSSISLDFDQDGNWHAVYSVDYESGDEVIRYLNSTSGAPVTLVAETPEEGLGGGAISVDPSGGLHVMFVSYPPSGSPSVMHMNDVGQGWSTPIAIATEGEDLDSLSLDFDQDGNWHAVYSVDYESGDEVIRYLNSTSGVPATLVVMTPPDEDLGVTYFSVDPSGELHVMFVSYPPSGSLSVMYMNDVGQGWSTPIAIATEGEDLNFLSLDFDQDGNWHAVYSVDYESGDEVIRYLNSTSGAPVTLVAETPEEGLGGGAISVDPSGGLHVMFVSYPPSGSPSVMHMNR